MASGRCRAAPSRPRPLVELMPDPISFDEFVDLLRERIGMADALEVSELHQFNKLMSEYVDVVPDGWWQDAFDELDTQGHLHSESGGGFGVGAQAARLSADGKLYLRQQAES
jgi:hypothetical protein